MPCDSITTQSISLAKANHAILAEALKAAGWNIFAQSAAEISASSSAGCVVWQAGKGFTFTAMNSAQAKQSEQGIVQAYSRAAVSWAAQRAGWQVASTDQNKMTLTRR